MLKVPCCCKITSVVSDSVRPHRWQPTRLRRPWHSPGKNTGMGCHFLLQCVEVKSESEVTQSRPTHRDPMDCSLPGSSIHGIFQARVLEWGAIAFSGQRLPASQIRPTEDMFKSLTLLLTFKPGTRKRRTKTFNFRFVLKNGRFSMEDSVEDSRLPSLCGA